MNTMVIKMMICRMGEIIKNSPYKRVYIEEYLGITANTLSNWCKGRTYPPADKLFKLAYLLGESPDSFYTYKEEKEELN
jgi:putative transcriptional regulator